MGGVTGFRVGAGNDGWEVDTCLRPSWFDRLTTNGNTFLDGTTFSASPYPSNPSQSPFSKGRRVDSPPLAFGYNEKDGLWVASLDTVSEQGMTDGKWIPAFAVHGSTGSPRTVIPFSMERHFQPHPTP